MNQLRISSIQLSLVLVALITVLGCGSHKPEIVPVAGTVTLDGQPVESAAVMLMTTEPGGGSLPAVGVTDPQGHFTASTTNVGAGVVPGKYQITVIKKETSGVLAGKDGLDGGVAPGGLKVKWIVPQKYCDPETSGLSAEIKRGMEPLKLELQSR